MPQPSDSERAEPATLDELWAIWQRLGRKTKTILLFGLLLFILTLLFPPWIEETWYVHLGDVLPESKLRETFSGHYFVLLPPPTAREVGSDQMEGLAWRKRLDWPLLACEWMVIVVAVSVALYFFRDRAPTSQSTPLQHRDDGPPFE